MLNYSELYENTPHTMDALFFEDNSLFRWGHPKALGYDLMAEQLSRDTAESETVSANP